MTNKLGVQPDRSRKFLVAGLTLVSAASLACPAAQLKVYADPSNLYTWTKLNDQNQGLLGGNYTSVASSANGSHLIIGSREGGEGYNEASPLYVSSDYGATWQNVTDAAEHRIRDYWNSVDVTDDGQTMVAASDQGVDLDNLNSTVGKIFISHNGGTSWTDISPDGATQWLSVAISGDGSKIAALANDDYNNVYLSDDGGSTWTTSPVSDLRQWESLSISDNGNKILVGGEEADGTLDSAVYLSNNGGDTWENISPDPVGNTVFTTRTALSADGSKIAVAAVGYNGDNYDAVYVSGDDGAHWTNASPNDSNLNQWNALAMSGNGNELAALDSNDLMYVSGDDGASWSVEDPGQADNDNDSWRSIDFNTTGSRIVIASDAFAYVGHNPALDVVTTDFTNAEDGKTVTLTTPSGTTVTCHTPVKESGLSAQDGAYSYPLGLVDFCFSGADTSNAISLTFVTPLKPNEVAVRKYNPTTKQYATIAGATITETTVGGQHALQVSYTIADNGPLDTNPTTGEVSDPVGLAVLSAGTPNTGLLRQSTTPFIAAGTVGLGMVSVLTATYRRKLHALVRSHK